MRFIKKILNVYWFVCGEIKKSNSFLLWILLFTTIITGIIPVIIRYIMKIMTSQLESKISFNNFVFFILVYVLILFFRSVFSIFREYINSLSMYKFTYSIQDKLIEKIYKIEYKIFFSPKYQNEYSTIIQIAQNESSNLIFITIQIVTLAIQLIITSIIIIKFNSVILVFLTVGILPTLLLNVRNEKERVRVTEESALFYRKDFYYFDIFTQLQSIKDIKIFNLKRFLMDNRKLTFDNYLQMWKKFHNNELLRKILSDILLCLSVFGSILLAVFEVIREEHPISNFIFFVGIIVSFRDVADMFVSTISRNYKCLAFANKLLVFLSEDNEAKNGNSKVIVNNNHILEFKDVSFKYPYSEKYALKNINFKISVGEKIALVGQNGCGKTTIINLILRLYDPTDGEILLDNINIKDYDYQEYLKMFSVVFQDYQTYSFKLTDYISAGDKENAENLLKIKHMAAMTTADQFIEKTSRSWESNLTTRFDKNGLELSGGQWQKLAVARALYSDAPILILDEPTSAMDAISESYIYENIEKQKTAIFISHRMYSSKIATKIIYMENSKIKNIGTHDDLMKNSRGYKKLFEEQANRY